MIQKMARREMHDKANVNFQYLFYEESLTIFENWWQKWLIVLRGAHLTISIIYRPFNYLYYLHYDLCSKTNETEYILDAKFAGLADAIEFRSMIKARI